MRYTYSNQDIIDTRDLIEKRTELTEQILDDFNDKFNLEETELDNIEAYFKDEASENIPEEDKTAFLEYWSGEFNQIEEINNVEDEVGSKFEYGCTLINVNNFEDYCEDYLEACGYFGRDFPQWIKNNIDWNGIAEDMAADYSELTYQGEKYYYYRS